MPRRLSYRLIWPILLMVTILWASGMRGPEVPRAVAFPNLDKIAHFFVFGLIGILLFRTLVLRRNQLKAVILAIVLTALFGALDEFRQSLNPHRHAEVVDWFMDAAGAMVAVLVYTASPALRNLLETRVVLFKRKQDGGGRSRTAD